MPFPIDDALYGLNPRRSNPYGVNLGAIEPRGEKGLLNTSFEQLMRLRSNPFFPYIERRIEETVTRMLKARNTNPGKREGSD